MFGGALEKFNEVLSGREVFVPPVSPMTPPLVTSRVAPTNRRWGARGGRINYKNITNPTIM
jgi:hypothetical protein